MGKMIQTEVAIVGGGVAGLWLLNLLRGRDVDALLFEQADLGGVQTMASQGMIHGGLKYTLGGADGLGAMSSAAAAIADMPQRWRDCFAGRGVLDLSRVALTSPDYFMFASGAIGRLGGFFASKALRGKIEALSPAEFPPTLQQAQFSGSVYRLADPVIDVASLLHVLSEPHADRLLQCGVTDLCFDGEGSIQSVKTSAGIEVQARTYLFCAGAGNQHFAEQLRQAGHENAPTTQLRPLHQVFVQHAALQPFYAHCLTNLRSSEPRLTITSHGSGENFGWYIGGALATGGVQRSTEDQIEYCRAELRNLLPWVDWSSARFRCLRIDRAEPSQTDGNKPDEACVVGCANALLCWPTKLALVPNLGELAVDKLELTGHVGRSVQPGILPAPTIADVPWL